MKHAVATSVPSWVIIAILFLVPAATGLAQDKPALSPGPRPPANVTVRDHPLDGGDNIDVTWELSPDDEGPPDSPTRAVSYYRVLRSAQEIGRYLPVARAEPDKWNYVRRSMSVVVQKCEREEDYFFKVIAVGPDGAASTTVGPVGPVAATRQLFDGSPRLVDGRFWIAGRFWVMVITIIICGAVIYWINHARKGRPVKVRKIAGLEAVDEAVGRATEMGRSCLFIPGIQDMNDIQTIAGMTILARVARTAAQYDAKVEVPTARALVMTAARETVHGAFLEAGRPDAYNEDDIYYVTDEQFGYVAYLQGMMVREKPAACFYMGCFYAESLILAETGNAIGAIQVAGTAMPAQLPFFVAACDYTLIGEEFFAASAYLSGEPDQLGSLKGQDVGKIVVALGLLVGVVSATLAMLTKSQTIELFADFIKEIVMQ
jgi:hypothetical protein